jgi:alpha-tubulin suppressor-like RCC1 family protein
VYAWGDNSRGQLGLDNTTSVGLPAHVTAVDGRAICQIACGGWHSAAVTESGKLFIWGEGGSGQLGHEEYIGCNFPRLNNFLRGKGRVRHVACGLEFTLVLMGEFFAEGGVLFDDASVWGGLCDGRQ